MTFSHFALPFSHDSEPLDALPDEQAISLGRPDSLVCEDATDLELGPLLDEEGTPPHLHVHIGARYIPEYRKLYC